MVNYFLLVTLSSLSFFFFLPSPSSSPLLCIYIYLPSRERVCFPNQKEPLLSNRSRNFYAGIIEASHLCFVFPFSLITLPLPPSLPPSFHLTRFSFFFFSATHRGGRRINQKSFEGETEGRERERRGGKWRGREEGVAKSIPQVNLRLEIFYTINKQGESGDGKGGEGEGGVGSGSRTQS